MIRKAMKRFFSDKGLVVTFMITCAGITIFIDGGPSDYIRVLVGALIAGITIELFQLRKQKRNTKKGE